MREKHKRGGRKDTTTKDFPASSGGPDGDTEIYRQMLAEAVPSLTKADEDGKKVKKRRVGGRIVAFGPARDGIRHTNTGKELLPQGDSSKRIDQTVFDDEAESSDDDKMEWEEVDLQPGTSGMLIEPGNSHDDEPLEIRLDRSLEPEKTARAPRRKAVTGLEKKMRLDVHKTYLLCLLAHVAVRNSWCNDQTLQAILKPLLSTKTKSYLNPDADKSDFQRSRSFMDGLGQVSELWETAFTKSARGMRRAYWQENERETIIEAIALPEDFDDFSDKADFISQANLRSGSRDFGAQLLCSLLRSVAVEARLVCSLQPLPFLGAAKGMMQQKSKPAYIIASDLEGQDAASEGSQAEDKAATQAIPPPRERSQLPPPRVPRLGRPEFTESTISYTASRRSRNRPKLIKESKFPTFWVEALNETTQKWIAFDPIVTHTIGKPSRFEPPSSDPDNNLSYVVAFEEDGTAVDVTRRYTKSYNAKVRKNRVESTTDGERWWGDAMMFYRKIFREERDRLESTELAKKEASEEMPKNVQDFKDHPIYALERHLRRNEVIHPRREVGKVGTSKLSPNKQDRLLDPVFHRRDVHIVRSAERWYRMGRQVKHGEQPLKRASPRRMKAIDEEDPEVDEDTSVGLYAIYQTELYEPPPVVNGQVPKNVYGNVDVYLPSMVPKGGYHLQHPAGVRAARLLGIDYAEAVVGFEFKGRQGNAAFDGIVAAEQYQAALLAVIQGFEEEEIEEQQERRMLMILGIWRRFLILLRNKERAERHGGVVSADDTFDEAMDESGGEGGGFLPEAGEAPAEPTAGSQAFQGPNVCEDDFTLPVVETDTEYERMEDNSRITKGSWTSPPLSPPVKADPPPAFRRKNQPKYILRVRPRDDADPSDFLATVSTKSTRFNNKMTTSQEASKIETARDFNSKPEAGPQGTTGHAGVSEEAVSEEARSVAADLSPSPEGASLHKDLFQEDSESEVEKSSLLSHDPDDDDADPEWIGDV